MPCWWPTYLITLGHTDDWPYHKREIETVVQTTNITWAGNKLESSRKNKRDRQYSTDFNVGPEISSKLEEYISPGKFHQTADRSSYRSLKMDGDNS
jgi:hypothetical protein